MAYRPPTARRSYHGPAAGTSAAEAPPASTSSSHRELSRHGSRYGPSAGAGLTTTAASPATRASAHATSPVISAVGGARRAAVDSTSRSSATGNPPSSRRSPSSGTPPSLAVEGWKLDFMSLSAAALAQQTQVAAFFEACNATYRTNGQVHPGHAPSPGTEAVDSILGRSSKESRGRSAVAAPLPFFVERHLSPSQYSSSSALLLAPPRASALLGCVAPGPSECMLQLLLQVLRELEDGQAENVASTKAVTGGHGRSGATPWWSVVPTPVGMAPRRATDGQETPSRGRGSSAPHYNYDYARLAQHPVLRHEYFGPPSEPEALASSTPPHARVWYDFLCSLLATAPDPANGARSVAAAHAAGPDGAAGRTALVHALDNIVKDVEGTLTVTHSAWLPRLPLLDPVVRGGGDAKAASGRSASSDEQTAALTPPFLLSVLSNGSLAVLNPISLAKSYLPMSYYILSTLSAGSRPGIRASSRTPSESPSRHLPVMEGLLGEFLQRTHPSLSVSDLRGEGEAGAGLMDVLVRVMRAQLILRCRVLAMTATAIGAVFSCSATRVVSDAAAKGAAQPSEGAGEVDVQALLRAGADRWVRLASAASASVPTSSSATSASRNPVEGEGSHAVTIHCTTSGGGSSSSGRKSHSASAASVSIDPPTAHTLAGVITVTGGYTCCACDAADNSTGACSCGGQVTGMVLRLPMAGSSLKSTQVDPPLWMRRLLGVPPPTSSFFATAMARTRAASSGATWSLCSSDATEGVSARWVDARVLLSPSQERVAIIVVAGQPLGLHCTTPSGTRVVQWQCALAVLRKKRAVGEPSVPQQGRDRCTSDSGSGDKRSAGAPDWDFEVELPLRPLCDDEDVVMVVEGHVGEPSTSAVPRSVGASTRIDRSTLAAALPWEDRASRGAAPAAKRPRDEGPEEGQQQSHHPPQRGDRCHRRGVCVAAPLARSEGGHEGGVCWVSETTLATVHTNGAMAIVSLPALQGACSDTPAQGGDPEGVGRGEDAVADRAPRAREQAPCAHVHTAWMLRPPVSLRHAGKGAGEATNCVPRDGEWAEGGASRFASGARVALASLAPFASPLGGPCAGNGDEAGRGAFVAYETDRLDQRLRCELDRKDSTCPGGQYGVTVAFTTPDTQNAVVSVVRVVLEQVSTAHGRQPPFCGCRGVCGCRAYAVADVGARHGGVSTEDMRVCDLALLPAHHLGALPSPRTYPSSGPLLLVLLLESGAVLVRDTVSLLADAAVASQGDGANSATAASASPPLSGPASPLRSLLSPSSTQLVLAVERRALSVRPFFPAALADGCMATALGGGGGPAEAATPRWLTAPVDRGSNVLATSATYSSLYPALLSSGGSTLSILRQRGSDPAQSTKERTSASAAMVTHAAAAFRNAKEVLSRGVYASQHAAAPGGWSHFFTTRYEGGNGHVDDHSGHGVAPPVWGGGKGGALVKGGGWWPPAATAADNDRGVVTAMRAALQVLTLPSSLVAEVMALRHPPTRRESVQTSGAAGETARSLGGTSFFHEQLHLFSMWLNARGGSGRSSPSPYYSNQFWLSFQRESALPRAVGGPESVICPVSITRDVREVTSGAKSPVYRVSVRFLYVGVGRGPPGATGSGSSAGPGGTSSSLSAVGTGDAHGVSKATAPGTTCDERRGAPPSRGSPCWGVLERDVLFLKSIHS